MIFLEIMAPDFFLKRRNKVWILKVRVLKILSRHRMNPRFGGVKTLNSELFFKAQALAINLEFLELEIAVKRREILELLKL